MINVSPLETRIALLEDKRLVELTVERAEERSLVGNIYKGRVDSIVPGIQAAFIDIGRERNGFLYVGDIAGAEGTGDFDFEDGDRPQQSRSRGRRRPSIEKMLKKGQSIMVQVQKDTLGTKGVRLTNFVTLPGRYVVLMPTVQHIGVSRKIDDPKERDRLKSTLRAFRRNRKYGLIIRTAGEGKPKEEIIADLKYLNKAWDKIKKTMERGTKTALLHEDLGPVLRAVREIESLHSLPVVMLTTSEHENDILETYDLGVNAYIAKPPGIDEFFEAMRRLEDFWFVLAKLPGALH